MASEENYSHSCCLFACLFDFSLKRKPPSPDHQVGDTNKILDVCSRLQRGSTLFFFVFFISHTSHVSEPETLDTVGKPGHLRRNLADYHLRCRTNISEAHDSGAVILTFRRAEKSPASSRVNFTTRVLCPVFISPPPSRHTFITASGGTCGSTCVG